ncbi:unnamed protein product [Didymodactylos carnosus]|uniref:Peptidyl-prolyl cis-trans isomerase n=1 Tax=Didymodactylos carnosus TaxID=1234261 RepID=A0A813S9V0_9BILA|nr:unnamed protein product [Didymodactylos carnosus]CAF0797292.1 unnamed protein product [Didymodactylos carnosus]CAF3556284.1 unnamed protein product [Didymodactylos carnosus]CAF3582049.1 unnamed protein product [Didymodactylos carnosus]
MFDGTDLISIYGGKFPDENFTMKFNQSGLLPMANCGRDSNGCQFFITCTNCEFSDGTHVVFGRVIEGMSVVRKIGNVPVGVTNIPEIPVVVSRCGDFV